MSKAVENEIKQEVKEFQDMETELIVLQNSLSKNKQFQQFINLKKAVDDKANEVWSDIETKMIENNVKSVDADWIKLTIVDKPKVEVIGDLSKEFMKRVPDTKKINEYIKSTGQVPDGVKSSRTKFLRKTFRSVVS